MQPETPKDRKRTWDMWFCILLGLMAWLVGGKTPGVFSLPIPLTTCCGRF